MRLLNAFMKKKEKGDKEGRIACSIPLSMCLQANKKNIGASLLYALHLLPFAPYHFSFHCSILLVDVKVVRRPSSSEENQAQLGITFSLACLAHG